MRVISATSRDLAVMRKAGTFREDLDYRLSVFPMRLPPLRERGEDVLLLAQAFVERFAKKTGRTVGQLTEGCRRRLLAYDWPGNVRELANVIERAVITARDGRMDFERAIPEPTRERTLAAAESGVIRTVGRSRISSGGTCGVRWMRAGGRSWGPRGRRRGWG